MEREEWGQKLVFDVPEPTTVAVDPPPRLVDPACDSVLRSLVQWIGHGPLMPSLLHRYWLAFEQRGSHELLNFEYSYRA